MSIQISSVLCVVAGGLTLAAPACGHRGAPESTGTASPVEPTGFVLDCRGFEDEEAPRYKLLPGGEYFEPGSDRLCRYDRQELTPETREVLAAGSGLIVRRELGESEGIQATGWVEWEEDIGVLTRDQDGTSIVLGVEELPVLGLETVRPSDSLGFDAVEQVTVRWFSWWRSGESLEKREECSGLCGGDLPDLVKVEGGPSASRSLHWRFDHPTNRRGGFVVTAGKVGHEMSCVVLGFQHKFDPLVLEAEQPDDSGIVDGETRALAPVTCEQYLDRADQRDADPGRIDRFVRLELRPSRPPLDPQGFRDAALWALEPRIEEGEGQ